VDSGSHRAPGADGLGELSEEKGFCRHLLISDHPVFASMKVLAIIMATSCDLGHTVTGERMMQKSQGWRWALFPLVIIMHWGCAVQYYDPATQTEHLWGVGHFKMKVAPVSEGIQAIVKGATVVGASVKIAPDDNHVVIGLDKTSQMAVVSEGASVRLEWPTNDLFSVRVGSRPPFLPNRANTDSKHAETKEGGD
jgi:hypothetical protein